MHPAAEKTVQIRLWYALIVILIGLGVVFRVANLDASVYWVDEVATSMRVSGYTQADVEQQLAIGQPLTPDEVLDVQTIRGDRPRSDLMRVFTQSPEHAPLYFVLMRFWAEQFGTSVTAMRSLSIILSLLALPVMYSLAGRLFQRPTGGVDASLVSWTAMGLLAISPFFVAYAQEARPYSLWTLLLLLESQTLWRSLQIHRFQTWVTYTLVLILTLYTSLLTVPLILGQGILVMMGYPRQRRAYLLATGVAGLMFLPWCWTVLVQWQTLHDNTAWTQVPMPFWAVIGVMLYGLAVLFFDVPVAAGKPIILGLEIVTAIATLGLIGYGVVYVLRRTSRPARQFILTALLTIPLVLITLDLVRNGQSAATPRYLIPTQLGVLLVMAYMISDRLFPPSRRWRMITAAVLSVSVLSCLIGINHTSTYQKSRNLSNPAIAALVNEGRSSQLIAEADQLQDIISLSYQFDSDTRIYVMPPHRSAEEWVPTVIGGDRPVFFFNPSESMLKMVQSSDIGTLDLVFEPSKLIQDEIGLTLWTLDTNQAKFQSLTNDESSAIPASL